MSKFWSTFAKFFSQMSKFWSKKVKVGGPFFKKLGSRRSKNVKKNGSRFPKIWTPKVKKKGSGIWDWGSIFENYRGSKKWPIFFRAPRPPFRKKNHLYRGNRSGDPPPPGTSPQTQGSASLRGSKVLPGPPQIDPKPTPKGVSRPPPEIHQFVKNFKENRAKSDPQKWRNLAPDRGPAGGSWELERGGPGARNRGSEGPKSGSICKKSVLRGGSKVTKTGKSIFFTKEKKHQKNTPKSTIARFMLGGKSDIISLFFHFFLKILLLFLISDGSEKVKLYPPGIDFFGSGNDISGAEFSKMGGKIFTFGIKISSWGKNFYTGQIFDQLLKIIDNNFQIWQLFLLIIL